jgi:hypothetical protein
MSSDQTLSLDALRAALADIPQEKLLEIKTLIDQMGGVEAARQSLAALDDDDLAEAA